MMYKSGDEVRVGDNVLINSEGEGVVRAVLSPGTAAAREFSCFETGGFVVELKNGCPQVWPEVDEDIELVSRGDTQ